MSTTAQSTTPTTSQIRQQFIDFFVERYGHTAVSSSPVVPQDDPTLLFTNAGMNQFKDVFLGRGERPYTRAVNSQKCIRAGGKHNDLEDVGKDLYHHTFFEMLGNWSFGDYFKAEAIEWAWTLLTEVWKLDPDRLYVTVFAGSDDDGTRPDLEAEELWQRFVPDHRISRWGKKDNFWEMGASGPCGPCSEIHYDSRPDDLREKTDGATLVNQNHPDVIEIWNLVFMEFNRDADGALSPLPAKHVDTGMGLERVSRILQGKQSNYDIDVFQQIFAAIREKSGADPYQGRLDDAVDIAYRVIADHIRCLTVAIADGGRPSNEGRGYVLRRILRRAVRHAHQTLNTDGAWLHELVPTVVETLGDTFTELRENADHIAQVIEDEENSFLQTLDRGIEQFNEAAERAANANMSTISAEDAFQLHDTYGFPIDLTRVMAEERGMGVDEAGYEQLMEQARQRSRQATDSQSEITLSPGAIDQLKKLGIKPTDDRPKFVGKPIGADVKAIYNGTDFDDFANIGRDVAIITDRTNFYAEAGGQVGDRGELLTEWDSGVIANLGFRSSRPRGGATFKVHTARAVAGYVLHIGRTTDDQLRVGDQVTMLVDSDFRPPTQFNHTATHLLNFALRKVLDSDVDQKGSLVAPDRLRFDFTSSRGLSDEEVEQVQRIVNEMIDHDMAVYAAELPLTTAKKITGVRAVFGEKYPDPVRVVSIGKLVEDLAADPENPQWMNYSIEFCGGTHVQSTGEAQKFAILSETGLAAGVRRIVAVTGPAAAASIKAGYDMLDRANDAANLSGNQLVDEFDDIAKTYDDLMLPLVIKRQIERQLDELRPRVKTERKGAIADARQSVVEQARAIADRANGSIVVEQIAGADKETMLPAVDVLREKLPDAAIMILSSDVAESKVMIAATVPSKLIEQGLKAGDWVREAAKVCGGGGGGRPDLAQAGGKDPEKVTDAMDVARKFAEEKIG